MTDTEKVCKVECKKGILHRIGHTYGYRFSSLKSCCEAFRLCFYNTGNKKVTSFNESDNSDTRDGINFVERGGKFAVILFTSQEREMKIDFCPFCGAKIEVVCAGKVTLVERHKRVSDGYYEIEALLEDSRSRRGAEDAQRGLPPRENEYAYFTGYAMVHDNHFTETELLQILGKETAPALQRPKRHGH